MDYQYTTSYFRKRYLHGYNRKQVLKVENDYKQNGGFSKSRNCSYRDFSRMFMNNTNIINWNYTNAGLAIDRYGRVYKTFISGSKRKKFVGGLWNVTRYVKCNSNPSLFEKVLAFADFINAGGIILIDKNVILNGQQLINWFVKQ